MSSTMVRTMVSADSGKDSPFAGVPVTITNQLSSPLDIYDVFNPAPSGQTAPYLYTKLGTIAAGATGTVTTIRQVAQLEAMYTGTIPELQGWYYYQFPIKLMSGTQFSFGNPPPLSYTITSSDRDSMIQSFLFHKYAMANPDSALTKNLNTALKNSDPTAVNTFLAGTQNFKSCTLSSWNAVMTWLTMFTSGWQGPYYLYVAAPENPPQNYVPVLIGTLSIVSSVSASSAALTLCNQDSSGNLQPLNPPGTATVAMAGDGTMVDQNPGQDVSLMLTPVWMNTIQTTMNGNQPQTSYISGPVVTGTVAGKKVVSTQTLMPLPSQTQSGGGSQPSIGAIAQQSFNSLCQVVGLIAGLAMLYQMAKQRNSAKETAEEKAKSEAKDESEYEEQVKSADDDASNETAEILNDNADKIGTDSRDVADGYAKVSEAQQKDVLTETIDSESQTLSDEINTQLEDGLTPTQDFENAVTDTMDAFGTAQQQIDDGNLSDASSTISDAATSLQQTVDQSASQMQQSEVEALTNSADAVSNASDQADALSEAQEKYEENMQNEENDSGAPDEDITPETEEIPEGL
jgi:hypothetical protein